MWPPNLTPKLTPKMTSESDPKTDPKTDTITDTKTRGPDFFINKTTVSYRNTTASPCPPLFNLVCSNPCGRCLVFYVCSKYHMFLLVISDFTLYQHFLENAKTLPLLLIPDKSWEWDNQPWPGGFKLGSGAWIPSRPALGRFFVSSIHLFSSS